MPLYTYSKEKILMYTEVYLFLIAGIIIMGIIIWAIYITKFFRILVEFKKFPVKWQRRIPALVSIIFVIPLICFWVFRPGLLKLAVLLTLIYVLFSIIYIITMCCILGHIRSSGTLLEHLHDIRATKENSPVELQKQLKYWYNKKYSIKRIEKYLKIMTDNDVESRISSIYTFNADKNQKNK